MRRTLLAVIVSLLFTSVAIRFMTPTYTVTIEVAPPLQDTSGKGLGALASLGGAASLLGGSLTPPLFLRFEDVFSSVRVADRLIKKYHLERRIFYKEWDGERHAWHPPGGIIGWSKRILGYVLAMPAWTPPDAQRLAAYLADHVSVRKDSTYGTAKLSYKNKNAALARDVVYLTYKEAEGLLIENAKARDARNVAYLQKRLEEISGTEMREAFITLLVETEQQRILVAADGTYAAEIIDGPNVPNRPSRPFFLMFAGILLVTLLAIGFLELLDRKQPA
jgi:hypothetical protein